MHERSSIIHFVPDKEETTPIEIVDDLATVVERIARVLPSERVWDIYSSTPNETGGRIVFPYSRVDNNLIVCRDYIWMLNNYTPEPSKTAEWYQKASIQVLETLVWVEVGFEGLENLAKSTASRNWTSFSNGGHFFTDEQRAGAIITEGAQFYRDRIREFVDYRTKHGITDDCFAQYNLEKLLDPFRATAKNAEPLD